jgi:hypothetical protein
MQVVEQVVLTQTYSTEVVQAAAAETLMFLELLTLEVVVAELGVMGDLALLWYVT